MVIGCLAALIALCAVLAGPGEPRHKGRPLSEWLGIYYESIYGAPGRQASQDTEQRRLAAAAIRAIGTNGLPRLLELIRYDPSPWHQPVLRALPVRIANSRPVRTVAYRGYNRAAAASLGFRILGSNAVSVIPELTTMMNDPSHPETAIRAISVLSYLGAPAFEVLKDRLADTNQPFRENITLLIGLNTTKCVGTNTCLPYIKAVMDDPDPKVRAAASRAMTRLTGRQTAIPSPQ